MTTALTGWRKLRSPIEVVGADPEGALAAKRVAEKVLAHEQAKTKVTSAVAERLKTLRENNHFGDKIAETMRRAT